MCDTIPVEFIKKKNSRLFFFFGMKREMIQFNSQEISRNEFDQKQTDITETPTNSKKFEKNKRTKEMLLATINIQWLSYEFPTEKKNRKTRWHNMKQNLNVLAHLCALSAFVISFIRRKIIGFNFIFIHFLLSICHLSVDSMLCNGPCSMFIVRIPSFHHSRLLFFAIFRIAIIHIHTQTYIQTYIHAHTHTIHTIRASHFLHFCRIAKLDL